MVLRLSALHAGRALSPQEDSIEAESWAMVRLEGLGQLKKKSSRIEPAIFRLVA
jgi:hypothetical protein